VYYQESFPRTAQLPGPRSLVLQTFTWSCAKRHTPHTLWSWGKGKR